MSDPVFNFENLRKKLASLKGPKFWRSLDELAETEPFKQFLATEYPYGTADFDTPMERREFLKLMGASLLMTGLAGCKLPSFEKIVPYGKMPEQIIPGKPLYFATAMPFHGSALGLLVESHMGRPTKVEGNAKHPDSLGAAHAFAQASVLGLYDPDRSKVVMNAGRIRTWETFRAFMAAEIEKQEASQGAGLRLLTGTVSSPTLAWQIQLLLAKYPKAKWHSYDPVSQSRTREGSKLAFGEITDVIYDFNKADVIVSLDADFLFSMPTSVRYARDFAARRLQPESPKTMNRLYAVESAPTLTGASADHRFAVRPSEVGPLTAQLALKFGITLPSEIRAALPAAPEWLNAAAEDLKMHAGQSLVLTGEEQPPFVHALVHAINEKLGNRGKTVQTIAASDAYPLDQTESLRELARDLDQGSVDLLVVLGVNPVYEAPADLEMEKKLDRAGSLVHLGLYEDETASIAHWHIPETHYLEMFSDSRAADGTLTMIQPLIEPLYGGISAHEMVALLSGHPGKKGYDLLREYWKTQWSGLDFEIRWRRALHDGVAEGSKAAEKTREARSAFTAADFSGWVPAARSEGLELRFQPDPSVWDGRFANNAWLQELPKPLTTLTWENVAMLAPATAEKLGLTTGEIVQLEINHRSVEAPVLIQPGHPEKSVTVSLGYGRTRGGKIAAGIGYNAYLLRTAAEPYFSKGLSLSKTGRATPLALTQHHNSMEGRNLVRAAPLTEYLHHPDFAREHSHGNEDLSMYPKVEYKDYAWGMSVNLNACIGCNACIAACQSENNVPVVGKKEVLMGREMHWIRIDRYYEGSLDNPAILHQPVMCMHCENAPCEPVCPVGATVHSSEGLNEMVYNRCVGTRYCANNCPYKVRRFNFLEYNDKHIETLKMQRNPNVTVRARGVMEKCTFCVQRINEKRIESEKENRSLRDGEIVTACQASCPTQALTFGDINDKTSKVTAEKALPLSYGLLTELNTRPRLTYLARVTNPNPALTTGAPSHG